MNYNGSRKYKNFLIYIRKNVILNFIVITYMDIIKEIKMGEKYVKFTKVVTEGNYRTACRNLYNMQFLPNTYRIKTYICSFLVCILFFRDSVVEYTYD